MTRGALPDDAAPPDDAALTAHGRAPEGTGTQGQGHQLRLYFMKSVATAIRS